MAELWTLSTVPGPVQLAMGRTGHGQHPLAALHGITVHHRAFNAIARHSTYAATSQ
jgi:hypothetical protein